MSAGKSLAGSLVAAISPQCRFDKSIFIIGHMRCGSTALSNIFCSRADVSGYGEAHIDYTGRAALGVLTLNQIRRGVWKPGAAHLFDKILHPGYDRECPAGFFDSRAVFMARDPDSSIRSIRNLFTKIGARQYATDALAADYYGERLDSMLALWTRFEGRRRAGLTYARLVRDPDAELARISGALDLAPPLENKYLPAKRKLAHGAGDPLASHRFDRIVASSASTTLENGAAPLDVPEAKMAALARLYADWEELTALA